MRRNDREWILVRHAPVVDPSHLAGRSDVECRLPEQGVLASLSAMIGKTDDRVASPARRCRTTAAALAGGAQFRFDERLWEQDFGQWEGLAPAEIPDLGPLTGDRLCNHAPPGGESFADLCRRVAPALLGLEPGRSLIVAHAGTIRAALALALGSPVSALSFEIAPLSCTLVRALPDGQFSIGYVNRTTASASSA